MEFLKYKKNYIFVSIFRKLWFKTTFLYISFKDEVKDHMCLKLKYLSEINILCFRFQTSERIKKINKEIDESDVMNEFQYHYF